MMPPELSQLQPLLTEDERSRCFGCQFASVAYLLAIFGLSIVGAFLLPTGLPGVYSIICAIILAIISIRSSFRRDVYYAKLTEAVTERLQDEVFLRFQVIPTRQIRLGREAQFVTVDNETMTGVVTLAPGAEPRFAIVQQGVASP